MSFMDDLKRSLGYEETEDSEKKESTGFNFSGIINDITTSVKNTRKQHKQQPTQQQDTKPYEYRPAPKPQEAPRTFPVYDDFDDDFVITPEQSFYEIVLIRPKTLDDINYMVDQILEEQNPIIVDLSFLERESEANFKLAGDKIRQIRTNYGAQALLLARSEDKNLIILSPKKVKLVNKG